MKKCMNPYCDSTFLYGNNTVFCPRCHNRLDGNAGEIHALTNSISYTSSPAYMQNYGQNPRVVPFICRRGRDMECHGRIVEVEHHEVFNSRGHKMFNSLFDGEPYQFAHQTIEYAIRVENITDGYSTEVKDFRLFGNYIGTLQIGDEVIIQARDRRGCNIVKSIYNLTTGNYVDAGSQISAGTARMGTFFFAAMIILLVVAAYWVITSGVLVRLAMSILYALLPLLILLFLFWLIFGRFFRR